MELSPVGDGRAGKEVLRDWGCTDSALQQLPHPLWQHPHSTSHLLPSPGGLPAFSCTLVVPGVGKERGEVLEAGKMPTLLTCRAFS